MVYYQFIACTNRKNNLRIDYTAMDSANRSDHVNKALFKLNLNLIVP